LRLVLAICISVLLTFTNTVDVLAQEFPYDRDLVLDARPMRGGRRVPVLSVEQDGRAQIDLWCKRGHGQATIAGDTITVAIAAMNDEPCTPERAQADEGMIAALTGVTNWGQRGDVIMLTGAKPLRFRLTTN
jgi:heat shock protein HslJ